MLRRQPAGEEILSSPVAERMSAFDLQAAGFLEALRNGSPFAAEGADAAGDIDIIEAIWRIANIGA